VVGHTLAILWGIHEYPMKYMPVHDFILKQDKYYQARTAWDIQGGGRLPQAARQHGVEGLGMAGPDETLGSLWIPLAVRA
jgi:hypothetical protein